MAIVAPLVAPTVAQAAPNPKLEIAVLSGRADMVSGGDALVEVKLPKQVDPEDVKISLDGRDISGQFAVRPNGAFEGLVTDLHEGTNQVTACISRGASKHCVMLTVTNHSLQGPIFAGKQVQPWICDTQNFGLGPASGPACVAATRNDFFYKSTNTNTFVTYDPASPPAAALIATTTTDQGKTVPYIVRRERGVIDRGIYDIGVLFDPAKDWQPWAPQPAWNGKLLMSLGGGGSAAHRQGAWGITDVLNTFDLGDLPLSRGFAVATGTLLLNQNNFSDIVEAEALMMIKEHFIKRYGPVLYTLSVGASSGGNSQYAIADNYPGLLDGLLPQVAAPDMFVFYVQASPDCALIQRYIQNASPAARSLTASARAAIGGAAPYGEWCGPDYFKGFPWTGTTISGFDASNGCLGPTDPVPDWVYNPQTNPAGVRCTIQDYMRNVFGPRASDGFAARPLDNAGVQYGLKAFLAGQISPDQFIDLNTKIGGVDIDSHWIPTRTQADLEALSAAYQAGLVTFGRQLAKVPIMDTEGFDPTDIHALVRPLMARARLVAVNGNANNQVIWDTSDPIFGSTTATRMNGEALITLDQWVANIKADTSRAPLEVKVIRHKPANAKDTCWKDGEPGAACRPAYSVPRIAAGGPEANNVLKCQLKPINLSDYGSITFTAEQQAQLNKAFPDGVCDWSQPGVDQQPPKAPWLSFMNGVGGQPVGSEPRSVAVR